MLEGDGGNGKATAAVVWANTMKNEQRSRGNRRFTVLIMRREAVIYSHDTWQSHRTLHPTTHCSTSQPKVSIAP